MIYFTAHTFKCVCHCRRAMFRVLGMYNFGQSVHLIVEIQVLLIFGALVTCDIEPTTSGLHMIVCMKVCPETKCHGNSEII